MNKNRNALLNNELNMDEKIEKNTAFGYFEFLINSGKSQTEQNKELLKILNDNRSTTEGRTDPQMKFGLNTNSLTSRYKNKVLEILKGEVL